MNYRYLQPQWLLNAIERFHSSRPTTRFQWWYFDFVLEDGTVLIVAFVPQQWWPSMFSPEVANAILFVSLRDPLGAIKQWTTIRPSTTFTNTLGRVGISNIVSVTKKGGEYRIVLNYEDIGGEINIKRSMPSFAASPFGILPTWLLRLLSQKRAPISYAALIPRGDANIKLKLGNKNIEGRALAYHEQGRFDGTTDEFQRKGWVWVHILGKEWSIFGAEDTFMYMTNGKTAIEHTFPMRREKLVMADKQYSGEEGHIVKGARMEFKTAEVSLSVTFEPSNEKSLTHWLSTDSHEIWSISHAIAHVHIEHKGKRYDFSAPSLLETVRCR